jgi:hypothetical protein
VDEGYFLRKIRQGGQKIEKGLFDEVDMVRRMV